MKTRSSTILLLRIALNLALACTTIPIFPAQAQAQARPQSNHDDSSIYPDGAIEQTTRLLRLPDEGLSIDFIRRYLSYGSKQGPRNKFEPAKSSNFQNYQYQESIERTERNVSIALIIFMVVVLPPAVFICIYAPGECLLAIGVGEIFIGGILHRVHSQDPTHLKHPWYTSPYLYVISGILWILAGLWKMYIQSISQEIEQEEAEERRRKYSFLRTKFDQEASKERRRKERERRRKQLKQFTKRPPLNRGTSAYEMVPLNKRRHRQSAGHGSSNGSSGAEEWEDEEDEDYMTV